MDFNPAIILVPIVITLLVMIIAMWKIFTKAGKPGWAILIPIYSAIVFLDITGHRWTRIFLYCIPIYGWYLSIVDINALSKCFGKGTGFTVTCYTATVGFIWIVRFDVTL